MWASDARKADAPNRLMGTHSRLYILRIGKECIIELSLNRNCTLTKFRATAVLFSGQVAFQHPRPHDRRCNSLNETICTGFLRWCFRPIKECLVLYSFHM